MSTLNFDWDVVDGQTVLAVIGRNERRQSDASLAWDQIAFVLDERALILSVNDTDELIVELSAVSEPGDWLEVASLSRFVAKPLGWGWVIANYRGYNDGFMVAFGETTDGLEPKLTFLAEGSAIICFHMTVAR
nr:DUF6334 family protein [uncultured Brevundimonas sp.]